MRKILKILIEFLLSLTILALDFCLLFFQNTALRMYRVPFTKRSKYLKIDKKNYLLSYISGILKYGVEMIGRTEKYWCPIKHSKRKKGKHNWEEKFADYGDEKGFKKSFVNLKEYKELDNYKIKSEKDELLNRRIREILVFPIIWGMGIIIIILDISILFYQISTNFLYNKKGLKRSDYIVFDRTQLSYLGFVQKTSCYYCSYVNGVFQYSEAIIDNNINSNK